jgi:hypothetical protein
MIAEYAAAGRSPRAVSPSHLIRSALATVLGWDSPRNRWIAAAVLALLALAVASGIAFFAGDSYAVRSLTIRHASPAALGNAMQQDHFYSSYRESTLVVTAPVRQVTRTAGRQTVRLASDSAYTVSCRMVPGSPRLQPGQSVTFITEGASADREPRGVLLNSCLIP